MSSFIRNMHPRVLFPFSFILWKRSQAPEIFILQKAIIIIQMKKSIQGKFRQWKMLISSLFFQPTRKKWRSCPCCHWSALASTRNLATSTSILTMVSCLQQNGPAGWISSKKLGCCFSLIAPDIMKSLFCSSSYGLAIRSYRLPIVHNSMNLMLITMH